MKVFDPDSSLRWLFCMTHPDDEISICAWIKRLCQAGNPVFLSWTHSNPRREEEGRAVARLLGVPQDNLRFLGAADGNVVDEIPRLIKEYREWLLNARPDRICCGAFEQGHIDHDATNFVVNQVFSGPLLEIPFYHTYLSRIQVINRFADPSGQEIVDLTVEERKLKTHVARQYRSQNIWSVLLWYEVWQAARFRPVELAKSERMRFQTHKDFTRSNLPPPLAAKVERSPTWQRWLKTIEPALSSEQAGASIPVRS